MRGSYLGVQGVSRRKNKTRAYPLVSFPVSFLAVYGTVPN